MGSTGIVRSETLDEESERALLLKVLEELKNLKNASVKQQESIYKLEKELVDTKEELERVRQQLQTLQLSVSPVQNSEYKAARGRLTQTPCEHHL